MKKIIFGLVLVVTFAFGCAKNEVAVESTSVDIFENESVEVETEEMIETTEIPETTEVPETTKAPETIKAPETTKLPETTVAVETMKVEETTLPPETFMFETTTIPDETLAASDEKEYKVGDRKVENGKTYEYFRGPDGFYWEEAVVERDDPNGKDDSVVYNGRDDINDDEDD